MGTGDGAGVGDSFAGGLTGGQDGSGTAVGVTVSSATAMLATEEGVCSMFSQRVPCTAPSNISNANASVRQAANNASCQVGLDSQAQIWRATPAGCC